MKIGLKLMATLAHLMPPGAVANKVEVEVPEDVTLNWIVQHYRVPPELAHLVLVNGRYIDFPDRDTPGLVSAGDVVAIWPPVAGG